MTEPIVTVVMPAYHCVNTIGEAIRSVLRQGVDLELIVVDDQSGDGLEQFMSQYAGDPVIFYVKNEKNLGAAGSRNRAVRMARGRYIAFLDADDWWADDKLKKQIALIEETVAVLCCTARELVTPDGKRTGRVIPVKKEITYRQLLTHNSINCSSVLIRSEVMKQYEMGHEDSHEDYILWLQILEKHQKACGINEPLLKYRLSSTGKSGNKLQSAKMTYRVYRYIGMGPVAASWYFFNYAVHGVWKYLTARIRRTS